MYLQVLNNIRKQSSILGCGASTLVLISPQRLKEFGEPFQWGKYSRIETLIRCPIVPVSHGTHKPLLNPPIGPIVPETTGHINEFPHIESCIYVYNYYMQVAVANVKCNTTLIRHNIGRIKGFINP